MSTNICELIEFREIRHSQRRSFVRGVMNFVHVFHIYCSVWATLGIRNMHTVLWSILRVP
jgi:hypothetical protein